MAKQNAYLAKQEAVQRQCFNDGWGLGTQQMCDYISLALTWKHHARQWMQLLWETEVSASYDQSRRCG